MHSKDLKEIQNISVNEIKSINELLMTLNHYPTHTLAATSMFLSRIILILNKEVKKDIHDLIINELTEEVDQNDLIELVYLIANNTLTQYKNNKDAIDERFSIKFIN